ncbi:MAG: peptide chain release factor N(5)-glutamine methyltransferase [Oscillospiraceae bacterium]|nr:peptide chain release factor N(5)-glutamine methyltransferase [Oscillospiraceae bacterium]
MASTYNNLYLDLRQQLLGGGILMASLEAREIMRHVTGKDRLAIARDYHMYVHPEEESQALALLRRRLEGEPIAYIIGQWEFFGLTFEVSPDVLIPRADTEVLAAHAIELAKESGPGDVRVLDLCTGCGCVGLTVAAYTTGSRVVLADVSEPALKVTRHNIRRHDLSARVAAVHADALAPAPANLGRFDVIVCNPPYIESGQFSALEGSVRRYEPHLALDGGPDGMRFFRAVALGWRNAVKPHGHLVFECGQGQAPAVSEILYRATYGHVETLRDAQGIERVVVGAPVWTDDIRDGVSDII